MTITVAVSSSLAGPPGAVVTIFASFVKPAMTFACEHA